MIGKTNVKVRPNKRVIFVDYIESTGTQYIDTGIKTSINLTIEAELACLGSSTDVNYSGAVYAGNKGWIAIGSYGQGNLCGYFCANARSGVTIPFDNDFHNYYISNGTQKIDDVITNITTASMPESLNIYICKENIDWTDESLVAKQRIKSFKIYDNGTLVRDYIPALDDSGVACLYDKVSETYFYNAGTGSFVAG